MKPKSSFVSRHSIVAAITVVFAPVLQAVNYYWDSNGTTSGLGNTAGTWGSSAFHGTVPSVVALDGTGSVSATATATGDSIYFGTNNLALTGAATTVTVSGTQSIGTIVFGTAQSSSVLLTGGTLTFAAAGAVTVNNTTAPATIASVIGGAGTSFTKGGAGELILTNANLYTGTTIVTGGGTLTIGNGSTGSLNGTTGTALTFNASGGIINFKEAAGSTQGMGALTFSAGDGSIISTAASGSSTATLTFASLAARTAGATGNFSLATNTTASDNKIVLTSTTNAPVSGTGSNDRGIFFGGTEFARYDTVNGYFRAVNYGSDNNAAGIVSTGATLGINNAATDVKISGAITAQTTASVNTLNLAANSLTFQDTASTLSVNGILSAGSSSAQIANGFYGSSLQTTASGGEMVIRVNSASDALTIGSRIVANGGSSLTKSGAGTLTLTGANTYTGTTTITGGTLIASGGSAIVDTGAVFLANSAGTVFQLNNNETIGQLSGGGFSGGNVNVQGNTLTIANANNQTFSGQFMGTSSGVIHINTGILTLGNKNTFAGTINLNTGSTLALAYGNDGTANPAPLTSGGTINMAGGTFLNLVPAPNVAGGVASTVMSTGTVSSVFGNGMSISNAIVVTSGTASIQTQGATGANDWKWNFSGGVTGGTSGAQTLAINMGAIGPSHGDRQDLLFSSAIADGSSGTLGVNVDFKSASGTGQQVNVNLAGQNTFSGPIVVANTKGLVFSYGGPTGTSNGGYLGIGGEVYRSFSFGGRNAIVGTGYLGTGANYTNTISLATGTAISYVSSANQTLGGVISGGGNLVMERSGGAASIGTLTLSAANTFAGLTIVNNGILNLTNSSALQNSAIDAVNSSTGSTTTGLKTNQTTLTIGGLSGTTSPKNFAALFTTASGGYNAVTALTLNPQGGSNVSYSGIIANGAAGGTSLTKTGAGTQTLSGANSYTGGTNVNAGTLLWSGANNLPGTGVLAVNGGGTFSLADGTARTTTANGGLTIASGARLVFDWVNGAADSLTTSGVVNTTAGDIVGIGINATTPSGGPLTLISAAGGSSLDNATYYLANATNYTATLGKTASTVTINGYTSTSALTNIYWMGNKLAGTSTSGVDNAWAFSTGAVGNWSSTNTSYTGTALTPGSTANVIFSNALSGRAQQTTALGADVSALSVTIDDATAVTIGGSNSLTLLSTSATAGTVAAPGAAISVTANSNATSTISANLVLGAPFGTGAANQQYINVASGKTLNISGVIGGTAGILNIAGAGTVNLSGVNTYYGATSVANGATLQLGNLNAIKSSDKVTVASGGMLQANLSGTYGNMNTVTIAGTGVGSNKGALDFSNGGAVTTTWQTPIVMSAASTIHSFGTGMTVNLNGSITGTGALTLSSRGTASGNTAVWVLGTGSSYTGNTVINNDANLSDVTVKLVGTNALPATTSLNLQGTGVNVSNAFATLDLNGYNQTLAGLTDSGGSSSSAGFGKRVINSSATLSTLTLNIAGTNTYGTTGTNILAGTIGGLTAGGSAANNLALVKTGAGALTLNVANTYTGGTTLSEGTLIYGSKSSFGTGTLTLAGGTKLQKITEEAHPASSNPMTNNIVLTGGQVELNVSFGGGLKDQWYSGVITGLGSLRVTGDTRTVYLAGNNDFTGGVTLDTTSNPWILLGHANALGTGTLTINATGGNQNNGLGANTNLTSGSGVANNVVINPGATFNLGGFGVSGNVLLSGVISGSGNLNKQDAAATTFILSGSNTYSGTTTVSSGTLLINGNSSTATGNVNVNAGTLGGTGTTGGAVIVAGGATLAPGASIESLAAASLSMAASSTFAYEVANNTATGADLLALGGTVSLTNVTLSLDAASLAALGGLGWTTGDKITLISYLGSGITSGFTGYVDDTSYFFGANEWLFDYNDTTAGGNYSTDATASGQNRFVTMTLVPEPSAALLGGLGLLALLRRRR